MNKMRIPTKKELSGFEMSKKELIDLSFILFQKLNKEQIDLLQASKKVRGLISFIFGVSYNDMHPTEESRKKESYNEWMFGKVKNEHKK